MTRFIAAVSLVVVSGCTLSVVSGVEDGGASSGSGRLTGTSSASGGTTGQPTVTGSGTHGGGSQGSTGQGTGSSGGATGGSSAGSASTTGGSCQFVLSPSQLDFGNQRVGESSLPLSFEVDDVGTTSCEVQSLAIEGDTSGSYQILSTSIQAEPGTQNIAIPAPAPGITSSLVVTLGFTPTTKGSFSAQATFSILGSSGPKQAVSLSGTSQTTCLTVVPPDLEFGAVGENGSGAFCSSSSHPFTVFDACGTAAKIQSIALQSGPGDLVSQFSLPIGPDLPYTFDTADAGATFELFFEPTTIGSHTAQLLVSDGTVTTEIGLHGAAVSAGNVTDTFIAGPPRADVLFVMDVASEPESELDLLDAGPGFFQAGAGVDYRVALTTDNVDVDGGSLAAELGRLLPCPTCSALGPQPFIISPSSIPPGGSSRDPAAAFAALVASVPTNGYPSNPPDDKQFFLALFDALTTAPSPTLNFFRSNAHFAVFTVNDDNEDDSSQLFGGHAADWYATYYQAFFTGTPGFSWNYVSSGTASTGNGFINQSLLPANIQQMLSTTHGFAANTSDPSWVAAMSSFWGTIFANTTYTLTSTPSEGQTGITVLVDGVVVQQQSAPNVSNWSYDASLNAIVFSQQVAPGPGATITVSYPIGCQ